jgi:5'-nucleotidase
VTQHIKPFTSARSARKPAVKAAVKKRPVILISNDDGIDAPGIYALWDALKDIGDVLVVAPHEQQSAVGHAITIARPIRAMKFSKGNGNGNGDAGQADMHHGKIKKFSGYAVTGTPADCVKLALKVLMKKPPDILVSGINYGSNTAASVIYSGTVSAATEGTLLGIPSVAVSLTTYEPNADFSYAGKIAKQVALQVLANGLPSDVLLNVNVPPILESQSKGIKITHQGKSNWVDRFDQRLDPRQQPYYWLTSNLAFLDKSADIDEVAVRNGYVSVTPIHYNLTAYHEVKRLRTWKF